MERARKLSGREMVEKTLTTQVTVSNPQGLHARPAHMLARVAGKFRASIEIIHRDESVDAKSILGVLTLGAEQGRELTIKASGEDAPQAIEALQELFANGFADEGEEVPEIESPADG